MSEIVLKPGAVPLAEWRAVYRGASVRLDPSCLPAVERSVPRRCGTSSPRASRSTASIPASASSPRVRIGDEDLATLQRNIVLSHAAGVGEPMPVSIARLMMALKLASLAQGASGIQPATLALLEAMLAKGSRRWCRARARSALRATSPRWRT